MWERIKAFIKSIVEYFVPKKTIKQIEEGFRNKLKKLATNPKYKQNIQQLILHTIEENQKRLLRNALLQAKGNKTKAAQLLGISRRTLHRKLSQWPDLELT